MINMLKMVQELAAASLRWRTLALGLSVGVSALNAQAVAVEEVDEKKPLYAYYYSITDPFINNFNSILERIGAENGYQLTYINGSDNSLLQRSQLRECFDAKRSLILNLVDTHYAKETIEQLRSYGGRVVFFNRIPENSTVTDYQRAFYVGTDPLQAGVMQGEMVAEFFKAHPEYDKNHNGRIDLVLIKGEAIHQDTDARSKQALNTLASHGIEFNNLQSIYADWNYLKARTSLKRVVEREGIENIELVLCNNDSMALGAINALQSLGYNKGDPGRYVPVFGIDALPAALAAIDNGMLTGTVKTDMELMVSTIFKLLTSTSDDHEQLEKLIGLEIINGYVNIPFSKVLAEFPPDRQKTQEQ